MTSLSETGTGGSVTWMLVSPNNRPLGRSTRTFDSVVACREAVLSLRQQRGRLRPTATATESGGRWAWRLDLDGAVVATSSRAYLRQRECEYNLHLFLDALPTAEFVSAVRSVRSGQSK
jgi:hypothetical protein